MAPLDAVSCELRASQREKRRILGLVHLAGGHGEFAMTNVAQAGRVPVDPDIVSGVRKASGSSLALHKPFVGDTIESIPAIEPVIAELPKISGLRNCRLRKVG